MVEQPRHFPSDLAVIGYCAVGRGGDGRARHFDARQRISGIEPAAGGADCAMPEHDARNARRARQHDREPHRIAALARGCAQVGGEPRILRIDRAKAMRILIGHELRNVRGTAPLGGRL